MGKRIRQPCRKNLGMESLFRGYWEGETERGKKKREGKGKERDRKLPLQKNTGWGTGQLAREGRDWKWAEIVS